VLEFQDGPAMVAGPFMVRLPGEHGAGAVIQLRPARRAPLVFTELAVAPSSSTRRANEFIRRLP
jgi:hypothetical protein